MAKKPKQASCEEVYAALLAHCPPATLPSPWSDLPVHADCFQCPVDGSAVLAELQQQFAEGDLVSSGIAARTKTKAKTKAKTKTKTSSLRLVTALRRPADYLVALRGEAGGAPFDLVTQQGCISGKQWPAIAAFADHSTRRNLKSAASYAPRLLVVFTMLDLVLCRCLEIPAGLAVGVDHGDLELLDALTPICGWRARERDEYLGRGSEAQAEAAAQALVAWAEQQAAQINQPQDPLELSTDELHIHAPESEGGLGVERTEAESTDTTERRPYSDPLHSASYATPPASAGYSGLGLGTGERRTGDSPVVSPDKACVLVLLGWQLSTLSLQDPPELVPLIDYLREVNRYLGIDLAASVDIWSPKEARHRLIKKRLEHRVLSGAVNAIQESFNEQACPLFFHGNTSRRRPTNFAEAVAHLRKIVRTEAQERGTYEERVTKAMAWFEQFLDEDVVTPLRDEAAKISDPIRRSQLLLAAELSRMLHRETAVLDHRLARAAANAVQRHDLPLENLHMKSFLTLVDRLLALSKKLAK